jgi:hypothetical protein
MNQVSPKERKARAKAESWMKLKKIAYIPAFIAGGRDFPILWLFTAAREIAGKSAVRLAWKSNVGLQYGKFVIGLTREATK